jgi:hypothetical protein
VVTRDSRATARSDGASDAYADRQPRSAARGAEQETPRACKNPEQAPWAVGSGHVDGHSGLEPVVGRDRVGFHSQQPVDGREGWRTGVGVGERRLGLGGFKKRGWF